MHCIELLDKATQYPMEKSFPIPISPVAEGNTKSTCINGWISPSNLHRNIVRKGTQRIYGRGLSRIKEYYFMVLHGTCCLGYMNFWISTSVAGIPWCMESYPPKIKVRKLCGFERLTKSVSKFISESRKMI